MTDVRTQLDKIRSDAAECMLLSQLVPEGKGQVFVRTAGHLNELAVACRAGHLELGLVGNRHDHVLGGLIASLDFTEFEAFRKERQIVAALRPRNSCRRIFSRRAVLIVPCTSTLTGLVVWSPIPEPMSESEI